MAWTAPRTWVTSEVVTAALLNAHLRDNLLETAPAKVTTAGDIVYATAANALARLAIGTTSKFLRGGSSAPSWTNTLIGAVTASTLFNTQVTGDTQNRVEIQAGGNFLWGSGSAAGDTNLYRSAADTLKTDDALIVGDTLTLTNGCILSSDATNGVRFFNSAAAERVRITPAAMLLVNDTSNANMTTGLTINQGAADDEILALKSSDVAHGMTAVAETDTFGYLKKNSAANGGLLISGHLDAGTAAIALQGVGVSDDTTKSTAGVGYVVVDVYKASGVGTQVAGADANMLAIRNSGTTRFLFDTEGSAHADVEWIAFDDHHDVALLDAFEQAMVPALRRDPIKDAFGRALAGYSRDDLERLRLIGRGSWRQEDGRVRAMVNTTALMMLLAGALRQVWDQVAEQAALIADMRRMLPAPGGA